jgi:hypothetical protein
VMADVLRVSTWIEVDGVKATVDLGEMTAAAMDRIALEYLMVANLCVNGWVVGVGRVSMTYLTFSLLII